MNRIESLRLERDTYGVNKGKLVGTIKVANNYGDISITIDPLMALDILAILAPALVATAQTTAQLMVEEISAQGPALIE